ncbi:MAG: cell division protein SepF [Actinobacteria bacterium]|nr:cell division protein SepF [Actinomycetota bacterium]
MAGMWHKTLVYFGLADEDDEDYYEDETLSTRPDVEPVYRDRGRSTVKKVDRNNRRRQSSDFDDIFADDPYRDQRQPSGAARGGGGTVRPLPTLVEQPQVRVHLVMPKNFNDAQVIADKFKGDIPVILNLQSSETELAKRLIDFASGLTYALDGGMQRVADKVFLLTPKNVEVSAEERQRMLEKGFFNQF